MADEDEAQDFFFARGDEASNLDANKNPMDYAANNVRIPGVNSLGGILSFSVLLRSIHGDTTLTERQHTVQLCSAMPGGGCDCIPCPL